MEIIKPCHVCSQEIGKHICKKCGRLTGDNCIDKSMMVCISCRIGRI